MDLVAEWAVAVYFLVCSVVDVAVAEVLATDVQLSLHAVAMQLQLAVHAELLLVHVVVATELPLVLTAVETVADVILADVHLATEPYAEKYGFQKSLAAKFQFVLPSSVAKKSLTPTV